MKRLPIKLRTFPSSLHIKHYIAVGLLSTVVFLAIVITNMTHSQHNKADALTCHVGGDIIMVIDSSDSMNKNQESFPIAQAAAKEFVDIVSSYNNGDRIGLVSFSDSGTLNVPLTTNYASVKSAIDGLSLQFKTCTQCAVDLINQEMSAHGRPGVNKIAIMLTDGMANFCSGWPQSHYLDQVQGIACALQSVDNGYASQGTFYFTIGLSDRVVESFLQQIVSDTGSKGKYYFAPTDNQLQKIYTSISQSCLPTPIPNSPTPGGPTATPVPPASTFSISGTVYTDTNGDQQYTLPPDAPYTGGTSTIYIYDVNNNNNLVKKMTTKTGSFNSGSILPAGQYLVTYTPLPAGYYISYPHNISPPSYTVTTGTNCDPGNYNDVFCNNGSVSGVDFGITNATSWVQSVCGDVRMDTGIIDHIPQAPSCNGTSGPYAIMTNAVCTNNPGIAYTGSTNADYGLNGGQAAVNPYNRTVGGSPPYSEVFKPSTSGIMHTSYAYMTAKIRQSGIATTDLSTICRVSNCTLPASLPHGVYTAGTDVTIVNPTFTVPANTNYVFLINGKLTLNGNISIPQNSGSSLTFSVSGDTTVAANVGNPLQSIGLDATSQTNMSNVTGTTTTNPITLDATSQNSQNATYSTITKDKSNYTTVSSSKTISWNQTVSAANEILIVGIGTGLGTVQTVSSVKFNNNIPLTPLTSKTFGTSDDEIWYLTNPPTGTHTITVTVTGNTNITAGSATYSNVDLSSPFGTPVVNTANNTTSMSVPVGSTNNQLILDTATYNDASSANPGSGQATAWTSGANELFDAASTKPGVNGTTTLTWQSPSKENWIDIGVPLNPISVNGAQMNWTHTTGSQTPQNTRLLIVNASLGDTSTAISSVSCNNGVTIQPLTQLAGYNYANGRDEMWYLKSPKSGPCTISLNITGGSPDVTAQAETYYNVDTTAALTAVTAKGNTTSPKVVVPSSTNQLVVDSLSQNGSTTYSVGSGQSVQLNLTNPIVNATSNEVAGGSGNTTMSWSSAVPHNWGEIAVALTPTTTTTNPTVTWNHTIGSQSNRVLLVGIALDSTSSKVASITYNGVNLTNLSAINCTTTACRDEVWYLKEQNLPAAGTYPLVVTINGSGNFVGGAATYFNADQTNTFGTLQKTNGNNITFSQTLATTANQMIFDALAADGNGNWNPGTGQVTLWTNNTQEFSGGSYAFSTPQNTTISWTNDTGNDVFADIAVALNNTAASAGSSATNLDGFYSTDGNFIINSNGSCDANQLQIGGSIIVGAGLQGGTFQNNRNLCSQNASCPSIVFNQRPDLLLSAPDFVKTTNHIWQEVAP